MTTPAAPDAPVLVTAPAGEIALARRLRRAGLVLVTSRGPGARLDVPGADGDWLAAVVARSPMAEVAVTRAFDDLGGATAAPVELFPGLWLVARGRGGVPAADGVLGALVTTTDFLDAEALEALCSSAEADAPLFRRRLAQLPPPPATEVPRLAALIDGCFEDALVDAQGRVAREDLGEHLAASYEELSLLYTITQHMTVVERPECFIDLVCRELHGTLPYAWVGLVLADDISRLKRLAGRCVIAGETRATLREVRERTRRFLRGPAEPRVLEPRRNPDHGEFAAFGATAVVQPVVSENTTIGVLIAGDKHGGDGVVSSGDLKLLQATASHTAIFLENAELYDDLHAMFMGTLESLTTAIDAKDRYTCGHSRRVALLTEQLARAVGLDARAAGRTRVAGLVHDVGKIGVPEHVLLKPGRLDEEEFDWIRRHPEMSYNILKDIPRLDDILPGVLFHHERWDGAGYPAGLSGQDIPFIGRLIALADSFDAMSSDRTYRARMPRHEVLAEIEAEAGKQFDPDLAPVFVRLDFSEYDRMVARDRMAA